MVRCRQNSMRVMTIMTPINAGSGLSSQKQTGASGIAYGVRLVEVLLGAGRDVNLVVSDAVAQTAPVRVDQTPLSLEDVERYLRQMSRLELGPDHEEAGINFASAARSMRGEFAEWRSFATDLRCEEGEAAWIRLFDTSVDPLGRSQSWLRVSPDTSPRQVSFPRGFTPALFTSDRVYGLLEAPNGDQRLA